MLVLLPLLVFYVFCLFIVSTVFPFDFHLNGKNRLTYWAGYAASIQMHCSRTRLQIYCSRICILMDCSRTCIPMYCSRIRILIDCSRIRTPVDRCGTPINMIKICFKCLANKSCFLEGLYPWEIVAVPGHVVLINKLCWLSWSLCLTPFSRPCWTHSLSKSLTTVMLNLTVGLTEVVSNSGLHFAV